MIKTIGKFLKWMVMPDPIAEEVRNAEWAKLRPPVNPAPEGVPVPVLTVKVDSYELPLMPMPPSYYSRLGSIVEHNGAGKMVLKSGRTIPLITVVEDAEDLPGFATIGDEIFVGNLNRNFRWDGGKWVAYGEAQAEKDGRDKFKAVLREEEKGHLEDKRRELSDAWEIQRIETRRQARIARQEREELEAHFELNEGFGAF